MEEVKGKMANGKEKLLPSRLSERSEETQFLGSCKIEDGKGIYKC
jgi:hypothetical protein